MGHSNEQTRQMKKNIALLAGGNSSEREISLQSAELIESAIDKNRYNTFKIDIHGRKWVYRDAEGREYDLDKNDFSLTVEGKKIALEYAFIIIHGTPGEDGRLQGYLDIMGIPYSSCSFIASAITFDKGACKRAVKDIGINLAKEIMVSKGDAIDPEAVVRELGLPMFVKPNASGSSFGVTKVRKAEEIIPAIEEALKESPQALLEEFIEGREIGCGVMIAGGKEYVFPVTEIKSNNDFFDFTAKYKGESQEITPADIDAEVLAKLNRDTLKIYKQLHCKGVVRIDFIVKDGTPYMIEVNSIPGMSRNSIVPQQARAMGMSITELINLIIEDTIA